MAEQKYTYWENSGDKTLVISSPHPNINLWFLAKSVVKLTAEEVETFKLVTYKNVQEVHEKAKIKRACRPSDTRQQMINDKYKDKDPHKKETEEGAGFNFIKQIPIDPITKQPVTDATV